MDMKIDKLDPNFAKKEAGDDLLWYDIKDLGVEGRGWTDTVSFYDRLPAKAKTMVREGVWALSQHSAGQCVRFISDTPSIAATWKLRFESLAMAHMPALGVSGLDLYVESKGAWRWLGSAQPSVFPENKVTLSGNIPGKKPRQFLLYLPLYNGVETVSIGLPKDAMLAKAPAYPRAAAKPIVFYGTSIVQGGCASRPGLAYPAIIGRRLRRPTINLGFSGNGPMDLELARLMAEIDAACYVFDCLPNMGPEQVAERTKPSVTILREARPRTPIVLVENITYQSVLPEVAEPSHTQKNKILLAAFRKLKASGVTGLHYVRGNRLLGSDWEGTVDGTHANDIGFLRMANVLTPVIRKVL
jgi:hypothetical protein